MVVKLISPKLHAPYELNGLYELYKLYELNELHEPNEPYELNRLYEPNKPHEPNELRTTLCSACKTSLTGVDPEKESSGSIWGSVAKVVK